MAELAGTGLAARRVLRETELVTTHSGTADPAARMTASPEGADPTGLVTRWAAENPKSAALHRKAVHVLPDGVTHEVRRADPFPLAVATARGARKLDLDGHELVCYVMGHGALLLGHGHPDVVDAICRQAAVSLHPGASHELELEWAQQVVALVPSAERVRFTSSGTEATLLALRLARAATGRPRIVKLAGHFHGWHDQVAFGADPPFDGPDTAGLPSMLGTSVAVVPADVAEVAKTLRARDVAAVILEPSGAAWGTVPLPPGFLADLRRLADDSGTLLVFDEVVSGFRWSPGGVQATTGVLPDLTALGKVLSGGMPGGAVCGKAEVMEVLAARSGDPRRVSHPGTHNAHPVSAAAGVATLAHLGSGEVQLRTSRLAATLRDGLNAAFTGLGLPGRAYGESSTFHLLFGHDAAPGDLDLASLKPGASRRLAAALHCGMLLEGVCLFHGSGFVSSEHTQDDIELTVRAFETTVAELARAGLL